MNSNSNDRSNNPTHTHFGFKEVPLEEKAHLVHQVFHGVANRYDLMNDLMSFGLHRLWKQLTITEAHVRPGQKILDIASGTGDLAIAFATALKTEGLVVMSDINAAMLEVGRDKVINKGLLNRIRFVQADAETLPFANDEFDCITIAFGLRNVTQKEKALASMYRVLKPGSKVLILEFSQPHSSILNKLYELYSFNVIPKMGEWIADDKDSYQYLVESIRRHPNQEALKVMMEGVGFEDVEYINLLDGIVALHKGYKY